jgi:hypothetical protein
MAKATGTIEVRQEVPPRYTIVKLDDGQGEQYSTATFIVFRETSNTLNIACSGTAPAESTGSNNYFNVGADLAGHDGGGADSIVPLYRRNSTTRGGLYFTSKYGNYTKDNTYGDWLSLWVATGSQPIMLEIMAGTGSITVDFNASITSNFTMAQGGTTNKMYRDGYGYHINVNNVHGTEGIRQDYIAHGLFHVLDEARRRGELAIQEPAKSESNTYVSIFGPDKFGYSLPLSVRMYPSGAAGADSTWQTAAGANTGKVGGVAGKLLNKPPFIFTSEDITSAGNVPYYTITAPIKSGSVTYSVIHGANNGGSGYMTPAEFAQHWAGLINNMPIRISASYSTANGTGSIALANLIDGTDGNVAISSSYVHSVASPYTDRALNLNISGMTGGAAAGGGLSIMARTRIGSKLVAVGGITRDNVASGSIEIGHLNFVANEGATSWGGVLADGDIIPVHDTSTDTVRGVELVDLKSFLSSSVSTNLTASGDVLLGDATGDTLNVTARIISSLVPKTDGLNDLGTNALAWNTLFAESGSFSDNVGIGNNLTVIDTISGSTVNAATLNVGTKATMVHADINDSLEVAGYAGFAGTVAISGALSLAGTAVTSTAAEINLLDGAVANTVVGGVAAVYGTTGQLTASALITNVLTASYARITSLDVDTIVSRTVTKDSLEIKDNLIIAGVSGSAPGDYVGAGFQLGGTVGVSGTGSSPLLSMTLGSSKVTGDALVINVDGQAGATFMSGGVTQAMLGVPGMRFGVTGSVSGSLLQSKRAEIGHIAVGKVSGVKLVGSTSVSGATGNFHDLTGDDCVFGGITTSGVTASNGVLLGSSNTDDLAFLGGLITDLVPQNDEKVSLGSAAKQFSNIFAASASFGDNVGVGGTLTAIEAVSGSVVNAGTLNVGTKATMVHADINDSLEVAGYAGFAGTVAISGALSLAGTAVTSTAAEINLLDGSAANTVVGSVAAIYGTTGQLTASAITVGGTVSGSASTFHDLAADDLTVGGIAASSITASNGVILGSSNADDLSFLGGLITDIVPQNDEKVSLGSAAKQFSNIFAASASFGDNVGIGGTLTAIEGVTAGTVSGSTVNVQTLNVFGSISGSGPNTLIKKTHLHKNIIQNNDDAHGGLSFSAGRLSVGWRKKIFVRADGSNISGSVPTKGMWATDAVVTPYTTASLGAVATSGSLMVYLNGILLHGEHDTGDTNKTGSSAPHADYRINSGSGTSNQWKILMNEDLALDSDDILTVTYLSGSGLAG